MFFILHKNLSIASIFELFFKKNLDYWHAAFQKPADNQPSHGPQTERAIMGSFIGPQRFMRQKEEKGDEQ